MTSPARHARRHEADEDDFAIPIGPMSFDEYLAFEEASDQRHEFVDGFAYAMAPVRRSHGAITLNIAARLWTRTRNTPCHAYAEQFQVRPPDGRIFYPDVMVSCGPVPPDDAVFLNDPLLIVEVLSRGTGRTDHGEKRESYQGIRTLQAYLIVERTWRAVHRHWREADGGWQRDLVAGTGAVVPLPGPLGVLTLDEIFERVELPPEPPSRARLRRVREGEPAEAYHAAAGPGDDDPGDDA